MKEKKHLDYSENILNYIKKEPGLSFRQLRFRLEMNESTLNRNLKNMIKLGLVKKERLRYFHEQHRI